MVSQVHRATLSTSTSFTWKKMQVTNLLDPLEYELSSCALNFSFNKKTTCFAFCSLGLSTSNWTYWMKCFISTLVPLCKPFPWPKPKKIHIQMHPPVIWGYWLTKYQGFYFWIANYNQQTISSVNLAWTHLSPYCPSARVDNVAQNNYHGSCHQKCKSSISWRFW
jgi:hypothetical protein